MSLSYKLAILCETCGHPRMHHRNSDGCGCTFEMQDWDLSWLRCGCYFFVPVSDVVEPSGRFL